MAALEIRSRMLVKDVMTSHVVTVTSDEPVSKVAQLLAKHEIGCVIVRTADDKPIGIITETDIVKRVVAKDIKPSKIKAKEIMSAPVITINADQTISEAARRMSQNNIRRLAVMHKGSLAGIISSKDILAVTPELIEIIQEQARIENQNMTEEHETPPQAGYCDNCEEWSDSLKEFEGRFLCEDCRVEMTESEY
ncbi:CBS domain-containing protein [Candidatus Bathyarchaeota archaeon]|nr:CBS domain-containing protein [Candidatus Bathyarchaeota archaeon]